MTPQRSALYTGPAAQDLDRIPADLKTRPQWVLWRGADRIDQQTGDVRLNKIPIDPQTLRNADTTDHTTWGTFEQCRAAHPVALEEWEVADPRSYRGGGLGFVFAADDPYAGIDLDHCRDPNTREIAAWARAHIDALASYTEVTPSGTGLHILVQGALPPSGRKKGAVEMYAYARFFTMTGWRLAGTPRTIAARHEALTTFHSAIFGLQSTTNQHGPTPQAVSTPSLEDAVLLDKARAAKNGTRFAALWSGNITGYDSPSNADLALCARLAFWTQDPAQIDRLFRQSGLLRDKWNEKRGAQTYGERTVVEALARQTEHYTPAVPLQVSRNGTAAVTTGTSELDLPPEPVWPQCAPEAFYGLAGEIVKAIAPQTESDPVAILGQLLVMVGNTIGRAAYFPVEATRHYPTLFLCLVGATSKGRKGTSAAYPKRLLKEIDPDHERRVKNGLSSGEGVIWNVRDPTYGHNKKGEEVCEDEGETDKRLCVIESEFARALTKTCQDGNTLSAVLRQAWDGDNILNTLVSGRTRSPVQATGAHVSVIAHITANELRRTLTEVNGMITNDKFCCIRWGTLPLSWWRRPLRLRS